MTGEEFQIDMGYVTVRALLHRGLLALLKHAYVFIRRRFEKRGPVWPCVAEELCRYRGSWCWGQPTSARAGTTRRS